MGDFLRFLACCGGMRGMTYNIRYDNPNDGDDCWENRKHDLVNMCKKQDLDILCVQEALSSQFLFLCENLSGFTGVGVGRDDGHTKGEYGPIFFNYNFEMLDKGTFWLSNEVHTPGSKFPSSRLPRICTWVKLREKSKENSIFFVFNTHLDHMSRLAKEQQSTVLLQQVQNIAGLYPSILTGDFNFTEDSQPYKIITGSFFEDTKVSAQRLINDHLKSFTEFYDPQNIGGSSPVPGIIHIDYILTSGFTAESWEQVTETTQIGRALSDHRPIVATVNNKYAKYI